MPLVVASRRADFPPQMLSVISRYYTKSGLVYILVRIHKSQNKVSTSESTTYSLTIMKVYKNKKLDRKPQQLIIELLNIADINFDKGNFGIAAKYFSKAIDLQPCPLDLSYALYMRGWIYQKTGESQKAHVDWQEAKNLNAKHPLGIEMNAATVALDLLMG